MEWNKELRPYLFYKINQANQYGKDFNLYRVQLILYRKKVELYIKKSILLIV